MNDVEKILVKGLLSNAEWINTVLFIGITLCLTVVILKILGKGEELEILKVKIPIKYFWVVVLAFTLAHWYTTIVFISNGLEIFNLENEEVRKGAFFELKQTGPLFFRGLIPRIQIVNGMVAMSPGDPTSLIAHAASIVMFIATVRIRKVKWKTRIFSIVIALILTVGNWTLGSNWAIAASELSLNDKNESFYYKSLNSR